MAKMTNNEIKNAARLLAQKLFVDGNQTATMNLDELAEAVTQFDGSFEEVPTLMADQKKTVLENITSKLPEAFTGKTGDRSAILGAWAKIKFGT